MAPRAPAAGSETDSARVSASGQHAISVTQDVPEQPPNNSFAPAASPMFVSRSSKTAYTVGAPRNSSCHMKVLPIHASDEQ